MTDQIERVAYDEKAHGDIVVTPAQIRVFIGELPEDAKAYFRGDCGPCHKLRDVVENVRDYLKYEYYWKCPRRPALPHERAEYGDGYWFLTSKGMAKWRKRLNEIADAFEQAFRFKVDRRDERGTFDSLSYD